MSVRESDDEGPSTPKKKKVYKQKFRDEWLQQENFKTWLRRDLKDPHRAYCALCNTSMIADMGALKRHTEGNKHILRTKPSSSQTSIATAFQKSSTSLDDKRKTAEIKLAAFMTEHKISHRVMDHLVDLLPKAFPDSEIAKKIKMKRTKLRAVISNVLGASEKKDLCKDLKLQKFTVMIDESTDIGSIKTMCVVVRYFCPDKGRIVSRFWDLIQIYGSDNTDHSSSAEHLFKILVKSFEDNSISLENIIGFGSDGCNTMMGCKNSVSCRFRVACPGIIVLKCVCHSLHLCASDACKQLPIECEKLARDIYNYFATSSKRQSEFKEFQVFAETDIHKLLKPAQTRWLSLAAVTERILEQWNPLVLFFDSKWLEDQECQNIHYCLNDPQIKAYYYFLNWMLPKFTNANTLFQSESPMITKIHLKMKELYRELLMTYIKQEYVASNLDEIDPTNETYFKNLEDVYFGLGVQKQILSSNMNTEQVKGVKESCRKFVIKACVGIRKRYSLNDPVMAAVSQLDPDNCMDTSNRPESLHKLFVVLPRLAPKSLEEQQKLDDQWRKLPSLSNTIDSSEAPDIFWHKLTKKEDFMHLATFMLDILALPNSNAECERKFSEINDIKTKKRNRLVTNTIKGNILARQHIIRNATSCVNFVPTGSMLAAFNEKMYDQNEPSLSETDSD